MKNLYKFIIAFILIALNFFLVRNFRVIPASKLWNGYSVLYVQADYNQFEVEKILKHNECRDFICLNNQDIPLDSGLNSIERLLAKNDYESESYLKNRLNYFFDKNHDFAIYYVSDDYEGELQHALRQLKTLGIKAGVNANTSYPWISFVITLLFAFILLIFSSEKILVFIEFCIPLYFAFLMPFYTVSAALCLLMTGLFFSQKFLRRKGALLYCRKNVLIFLSITISFFIIFLTSPKLIFLLLSTAVAMISAGYIYYEAVNIYNERYSFRPVLICSASMVKVIDKKNRIAIPLCFFATLTILISGFFSLRFINFSLSTDAAGLMLPSRNAEKKVLPDLNDYVVWNWKSITFPYRSLNDSSSSIPKKGDVVNFQRYFEENGKISVKTNSIIFDDSFRLKAVNSIDNFDYNSIEKMLKDQGSYIKPGYSGSGGSSLNLLGIVLLILASGVSCFFYFSFYRTKAKQENKK